MAIDETNPPAAPARAPRLSRMGLIVWLLAPLAIVVAMWFMIPHKVKPDPRLMDRHGAAPTSTDAAPIVAPSR